MLALFASSAINLAGSAGSAIGKDLSGLLKGGSAEDARRQARADWFLDAAERGSITAMRVVASAQRSVSANEFKKEWSTNVGQAQSAQPMLWTQANAQAPLWDGKDFGMTAIRNQVVQELAAIGQSAPAVVIPGSTAPNAVQVAVADAVNGLGSQLSASAANGINPAGNYAAIPTSRNSIWLWAALAAGAVFVLTRHHNNS